MKTYTFELNEAEILIIHRALIGRRGDLYGDLQRLNSSGIIATDARKNYCTTLIDQTDAIIEKVEPYVNYSPEVDYENNWVDPEQVQTK